MNYLLQVNATTSNQGLINAIVRQLPDIDDVDIYNDGYYVTYGSEEDNKAYNESLGLPYIGLHSVKGYIKFYSDNDRLGIVTSLRGLQGIINSCESGSYIIGYEGEEMEGITVWENKTVYEVKA